MKLQHKVSLILTAAAVIGSDQATKVWAAQRGWVVHNPGVSFGFLSTRSPLFIILVVTGILCAIWWVLRSRRLPAWWWGVLIGGTVSNLLDRIIYQGVQDWLPLPFVSLSNNLADWMICFCLVWLCVKEYRTIRS